MLEITHGYVKIYALRKLLAAALLKDRTGIKNCKQLLNRNMLQKVLGASMKKRVKSEAASHYAGDDSNGSSSGIWPVTIKKPRGKWPGDLRAHFGYLEFTV